MTSNLGLLIPVPPDRDTAVWATVTAVAPLRIRLDSDGPAGTPLPFTPDALVGPLLVGDRVWCALATNADPHFKGRRVLIVGVNGGDMPWIQPVADQTARDALTGDGRVVWRQDLRRIEVLDGATWRASGIAKIDERLLSSTTADVTFSSIPDGYSELQLRIQARSTNATSTTNVLLQFNGDTAANYDGQSAYGQTTGVGAAADLAATSIVVPEIAAASAPANHAGTLLLSIHRYAGTAWLKIVDGTSTLSFGTGAGSLVTRKVSGRWRSAAAITSIRVLPSAGSFAAGSTVTLYGLP